MNSSKINEWLSLVANLAVVAGIIFLAIQIRQNNELLRSESRQTLVSNDVTSLAANLDNVEVFAKLISQEELSAEDQLRLSFMFAIDIRNREFEYFQYINGLLDEETWLSYRRVILINHSNRIGRAWWNDVGRGIVDPEFAKRVAICWWARSQMIPIDVWQHGQPTQPRSQALCGETTTSSEPQH